MKIIALIEFEMDDDYYYSDDPLTFKNCRELLDYILTSKGIYYRGNVLFAMKKEVD